MNDERLDGPPAGSPMDDLVSWIRDVLAAENFVRASTGQLLESEAVRDTQAALLLRLIELRARKHVEDLEELLDQIGEQPSALRDAVGAGLGSTLGWLEQLPGRDLVHMVRDVYVALNYMAGGYHVLYTRAVLLVRPASAGLALRHLRDYTPAIRHLSQLIAWAAALDLPPERRLAPGALQEITGTLFDCWSSDVPLWS